MNSIRNFRAAFFSLMAMCPVAAPAQNAVIVLYTPSARVVAGAQLQMSATITDIVGTPIDASGLTWSPSDSTIVSVSAQGMVSGVFPGDVTIAVTDANTGATASVPLHVVPLSFTLQTSASVIRAGDSAKLTATALDANSKAIPGLVFQYQSGDSGVAAVQSDGSVTGVAEGFVTVLATIPSATSDASLVATTQIQVLPPSQYSLKKMLTTETLSATTIAAYSMVAAENPAEIGTVVTLANGGQAAMLIDNGKPKVLAVAGQVLPNAGRMVLRIWGISANANGDVALLVEYPAQWCTASVILFPRGKPEQELGSATCYGGLHQRSLANDGSAIARVTGNGVDQIVKLSANADPQVLFALGNQPGVKDPVKSVNDFVAAPNGTFILNAYLNSGAHVYLYFDGKNLTQVYKDGDLIRNTVSNSMDLPVGASDGSFYARVNGSNFEALQQLAPGTPKTLVMTGDSFGTARLGWIHTVTDAGAASVLLMGDAQYTNDYHTSMLTWKSGTLSELVPAAGWNAMVSGAMPSGGIPIVSAFLPSDAGPVGLRSISGPSSITVLQAAGASFPQSAPAGIDWHYASRGGSATSFTIRGAGDALVQLTGGTAKAVLTLGSALPNGKPATWIGGVIGNQNGDAVLTVGYSTGSMLLRYRAGKIETVADTAVTKGPNNVAISYFFNYRGRFLAMNNRGDVASVAGYGNNSQEIVLNASDGPHLVAQQSQPAPGGGNYSNFGNIAIDENGRVVFICSTTNGSTAAYYWDGTSVSKLVGLGDTGPSGLTVNEVSNVAGGGSGFLIMLAFGNYQTRELRSFNGKSSTTIISTDTTYLDGTGLNWFWMNECTLAGTGDAHCMVGTQDGGSGVYAHRAGNDVIVARTRDQLAANEWLIGPLIVNSSTAGEVWFAADVLVNGVEQMALYQAIPH